MLLTEAPSSAANPAVRSHPRPRPGSAPARSNPAIRSGLREAHEAALAALENGGSAVLLGEAGTGKTLLLQDLARALWREGRSVCLYERGEEVDPGWRADALLIDDADRLSDQVLANLCASGTSFVLGAKPGFARRLARFARGAVRVPLGTLAQEDAFRFIVARLSARGRPRDLIDPAAILALAQRGAGLPGRIDGLMEAAIRRAEADGAARVLPRHVEAAASAAVDPGRQEPRRDGGLRAAPIGAVPARPGSVVAAPSSTRPGLPRPVLIGAAAAGILLVLAAGWGAVDRLVLRPGAARPQDRAQPTAAAVRPSAHAGVQAAPTQAAPTQAAPAQDAPAQAALAVPPAPAAAPSGLAPRPDVTAAQSAAAQGSAVAAQPVPTASPPPANPLQKAEQADAKPVTEAQADAARQAVQQEQRSAGGQPAAAADPTALGSPGGDAASRRTAAAAPAFPGKSASFRGAVRGDGMQPSGQMSLVILRRNAQGAITARLDGRGGLTGTGELVGTLGPDGRLTAAGRLMVGDDPFYCDLQGVIRGGTLAGSANLVPVGGGAVAHSTFVLGRP